MRVFLSGRISNYPRHKMHFAMVESYLSNEMQDVVINPSFLPVGFEHDAYIRICKACIDECDAVYFLDGWEQSKGSNEEFNYAIEKGKQIIYETCENQTTETAKIT